jgi:dynein heavy chain
LCCRFDPAAASFTLESVVSLRLDQHAEFIAELSVNATKELAIENSLAAIAATWAGLSLDLAEYKGTFKLRSTEDIFAALEDNSVTLSTMKASKYYLVFEKQVGHWESTLALVSETVEVVLQVRWLGDTRKPLPLSSHSLGSMHCMHWSYSSSCGMCTT